MTIRNLEFALRPGSLAVFGASERPGSLGAVLMQNIRAGGFRGPVWPVNPIARGWTACLAFRTPPCCPQRPISR